MVHTGFFAKLNRLTDRVFFTPLLVLQVTDRCNSRCLMCDFWKKTSGVGISPQELEKIVMSAASPIPVTVVVTGGEPLLRDDLFDLWEKLNGRGMRLILNTNGILLREYVKDVSEIFDRVVVSLDSHDAETYREIRGCDEFDKVVDGIRAVVKAGSSVILAHTLQKKNILGIADFLAFSRTLEPVRISIRPVDVYSNGYGRKCEGSCPVEELLPSIEETSLFSNLLGSVTTEWGRKLRSGLITPPVDGLWDIRDYFIAANNGVGFPRKICNLPYISAIVNPSGGIRQCFFSGPSASPRALDCIHEVLNSRDFRDGRRRLKTGKALECEKCVFPYCSDL